VHRPQPTCREAGVDRATQTLLWQPRTSAGPVRPRGRRRTAGGAPAMASR
jgi:hypothetical protein